jgi:hypothetical protein
MEYHFYNLFHYGDTILNLKFLMNLVPILQDFNIVIYYYYNQHYNKNKREFEVYLQDTNTIQLRPIEDTPAHATHLWIGQYPTIEGVPYSLFDTYYNLYYKNILTMMKLDNLESNTSLYLEDQSIIERYHSLPDKYKNVDILVLNTPPQSGQITYDKQTWDEMCYFLALKYKIVTAQHVHPDIECTMRDGLTMRDIGAISTHCTYIIGVHSGPMTACYTAYTKNSVKKWFVFCDKNRHEEIDAIDHCTIPQVYEYFRFNCRISYPQI